ncbi:Do family serine endopeptidase [Oleiharenicola lentus]|uniref:Do family serine endopeptidase n=1 Tax=Oleiharenicola lentus TaxID=2508720 RepID=UPI003F66F5A5
MKTKSVTLFAVLSVSLLGFAAGLFAAEKKPADKPVKKPEVKVDSSPVSDAKSAVVLSYADSLESIRNAVVSVHSQKMVRQRVPEYIRPFLGNIPDQQRAQKGLGSGVIVASNGYIITNNHVVEGADELKVLLNDEREFTAKVIGTDPKTDVAVIKIEAENLPAATLADSSKLRIGDVVFAIGNPLGVGQTVTMGIVSATSRRNIGILDADGYEDFIQTDAAINQGNSGGALIDARGRLVGINSAILSTSQGNIGIGFAIPINLASTIMHSLIETGLVSRGYLGVSTDVLTSEVAESFGLKPNQKGVIITELNPADGPAAKAGLKRDDIITSINDKSVSSVEDLRLVIAQTPPNTKVSVNFIRDGKSQTKEITLGKLDDAGALGELITGVSVSPLNDQLRKEMRIDDRVDGLVITDIADNSPYSQVFPQGAVIEQLNRVPMTDVASAKKALRDGRNVALVYYRGAYRYVPFTVR